MEIGIDIGKLKLDPVSNFQTTSYQFVISIVSDTLSVHFCA